MTGPFSVCRAEGVSAPACGATQPGGGWRGGGHRRCSHAAGLSVDPLVPHGAGTLPLHPCLTGGGV